MAGLWICWAAIITTIPITATVPAMIPTTASACRMPEYRRRSCDIERPHDIPRSAQQLLCGRAESAIRNKPDLIMTVNGHADKGGEWSPMERVFVARASTGTDTTELPGLPASCYTLVYSALLALTRLN